MNVFVSGTYSQAGFFLLSFIRIEVAFTTSGGLWEGLPAVIPVMGAGKRKQVSFATLIFSLVFPPCSIKLGGVQNKNARQGGTLVFF